MSRIKIDLPSAFKFSTKIKVRITDLNYGNHVGNDTVLSLFHEARVQYLESIGFKELEFAGFGLIMSDAALVFRNEIFYGEELEIFVGVGNLSRAGFDLFYKIITVRDNKELIMAEGKTGMICYDYSARKVVGIPLQAREKLVN